jgi:hypothetical protein
MRPLKINIHRIKFIHSLDFLALRAVLFDQAKRTAPIGAKLDEMQ